MRARVLIPHTPEYPWQEVERGLKSLDIGITDHGDENILITWSPWVGTLRDGVMREFQAFQKPVIIMENGWLSPIQGKAFYQVALNGWNGTGRFWPGNDERWLSWRINLAQWRLNVSGTCLIIGQRGHPFDPRTMPTGWFETFTPKDERRIVRRPRDASRPLRADLDEADVVHTWSSNAASWAVVAGVPVVQHGPNLMVSALASAPGAPLCLNPREPVLERLAWAQWDSDELATGEPFYRLLEVA